MSSFTLITQVATDIDSNDAPPPYNEAFKMCSTDPPPYNVLFMAPVYAGIFGAATSLIFDNHSANCNGYSFGIHDTTGRMRAIANIGPINTTVTDLNGMEIFKFSKNDSDDLKRQGIYAFEMRDKNMVSNTIQIAGNGRSIQIIHKYSDPELIVRSIRTGQFAVFRGSESTNPLCNVHVTKSFKRGEVSGSIKFHTETDISTLEQLLCTASAIAMKIVIKEAEGKKCLFNCVVISIVCFIISICFVAYLYL